MAKKLGYRTGCRATLIDAPPDLAALLAPLPDGVVFTPQADRETELVHVFATERAVLAPRLETLRRTLDPDAMLWVSWPKKAARVPTDLTEDVIRALALPLGFVDVKVCAVDATWSALKLVVRKALRPSSRR
ncbi:MAG: DUF3052 domain-containing protein [Piscinibacter sp.]|nr:DUF3052 domain-containing protein [Piscinibacter sp.]